MAFAAQPPSPEAIYDGILKSLKGDDAEYLMTCVRALKVPGINVRMEGEDLLTLAIRHNARFCIEPLKRLGFSLDRLSVKDGKHPLEEAMDAKSALLVEVLLRYGANPNAPHTRYGTIMHAAAATRLVDSLIPVLISKKGDPNAVSPRDGTSPVHAAVAAVQVLNLEQLLERGANINAVDHLGRTPLHVAVALPEYDPIAFVLLDHGADAMVPDAGGLTALDLAKVREEPPLIKILEERSSWEALLNPATSMARNKPFPPEEFRRELLSAVNKGDQKMIRDLFENRGGDNWPPTAAVDQSPLLSAFMKGRLDLAALLIGYKLGVSDRGDHRRNVAHYLLLSCNQIPVLTCFFRKLHEVNALCLTEPDDEGHQPLALAVASGVEHHYDEVNTLIGSAGTY